MKHTGGGERHTQRKHAQRREEGKEQKRKMDCNFASFSCAFWQLTCRSSRTRRPRSGSTSWSASRTPRCRCCNRGEGRGNVSSYRPRSMFARRLKRGMGKRRWRCMQKHVRRKRQDSAGRERTCSHTGGAPPWLLTTSFYRRRGWSGDDAHGRLEGRPVAFDAAERRRSLCD